MSRPLGEENRYFVCTKKGMCCHQNLLILPDEVEPLSDKFFMVPVEMLVSPFSRDLRTGTVTSVREISQDLRIEEYKIKVRGLMKKRFPVSQVNFILDLVQRGGYRLAVDIYTLIPRDIGCLHLKAGLCTIYEDRPVACRGFPLDMKYRMFEDASVSSECLDCAEGSTVFFAQRVPGSEDLFDLLNRYGKRIQEGIEKNVKITGKALALLRRNKVYPTYLAILLSSLPHFITIQSIGGVIFSSSPMFYLAFWKEFFEDDEKLMNFIERQFFVLRNTIVKFSSTGDLSTLSMLRRFLPFLQYILHTKRNVSELPKEL